MGIGNQPDRDDEERMELFGMGNGHRTSLGWCGGDGTSGMGTRNQPNRDGEERMELLGWGWETNQTGMVRKRWNFLGWGTDTGPVWDGVEGMELLGWERGTNQTGMVRKGRNFWDGDGQQGRSLSGIVRRERIPWDRDRDQGQDGVARMDSLGWGTDTEPGQDGFSDCQDQTVSVDVSTAGSLCLAPEKPRREWGEVEWRVRKDSGLQQRILTAKRADSPEYPKGPFHGRADFQPETLSLCISPMRKEDSGVYKVEINPPSSEISFRCFRVSVWDPVRQPRLEAQIQRQDQGWCLLSLLCSSTGNVSHSWACPGDPPGTPESGSQLEKGSRLEKGSWLEKGSRLEKGSWLEKGSRLEKRSWPEKGSQLEKGSWMEKGSQPEDESWLEKRSQPEKGSQLEDRSQTEDGSHLEKGSQQEKGSRLLRNVTEGAEPQICLCNVSNPAGWSAASTELACPPPGIFGAWAAAAAGLTLLLVGSGCFCWRRKRSQNSREATPGTPPGPPEQPLTIYAEVGVKKPGQDPTGTSEATQEGATIYAMVSPRTLELPRCPEEPGTHTVYSMVQFGDRPSSCKKKRLDRALVSTAYLEDNGDYRRLGFPSPAGHQHP